MIVTILVSLYLDWQTYKGSRIGFTRKVVNLTLSAVFFLLATILQNPFGNFLYSQYSGQDAAVALSQVELMAARFIAFFIIFCAGKRTKRMSSKWLPTKKNEKGFSSLLGDTLGVLASLIAAYLLVYAILSMCNALRNQWFIQQAVDSPFLRFIIYQTPGLSNGIFNSLFNIGKTAE